jgi:hypothetical protein
VGRLWGWILSRLTIVGTVSIHERQRQQKHGIAAVILYCTERRPSSTGPPTVKW